MDNMVEDPICNHLDKNAVMQEIAKLHAQRVGLLKDYTVALLQDRGIETSVARAIVDFVQKCSRSSPKTLLSQMQHEYQQSHSTSNDRFEIYDSQKILFQDIYELRGTEFVNFYLFLGCQALNLDDVISRIQTRLAKPIDAMISDSAHYNPKQLKELLGQFYSIDAPTQLPVVEGEIATRFLGMSDPGSTPIVNAFNAKMSANSAFYEIWISPSGTGKTFELLKFACHHHCLMFFGRVPPQVVGIDVSAHQLDNFESGMKDATMETVVQQVIRDVYYSKNAGLFNNLNTEYFMSINILTRLIILHIINAHCMERFQRIVTPKELLISQLNGNIDVINRAYVDLCNLQPSPESVIGLISQMKAFLADQNITVSAVLDEAYVLSNFVYVYCCCTNLFLEQSLKHTMKTNLQQFLRP